MSPLEKKTPTQMSPDEALRAVASMRAEMVRQYRTHPMVQAASAAATEINDILNAVSLRLALLRWQQDGGRNDASIARLSNLVEHAAIQVRQLQDYARAIEVATFALRPIELPESAVVSDANTNLLRRSARTRSLNTAARVLVVSADDNLKSITGRLEDCGCTITVAESPDEALSLLDSARRFDHIVCDASIIDDTGLEFAAELCGSSRGAKVFLIAREAGSDHQIDRLP
jgi:CheY-like chemotaxis protein